MAIAGDLKSRSIFFREKDGNIELNDEGGGDIFIDWRALIDRNCLLYG